MKRPHHKGRELLPLSVIHAAQAGDAEAMEAWLTEKLSSAHGAKVRLVEPQRGERSELVELAERNAKHTLMRYKVRTNYDDKRINDALAQLESALALDRPPMRIECFDISTLHGAYTVASMVVFTGGKPDKNQYRRFKIRAELDMSSLLFVIDRFADIVQEPRTLCKVDVQAQFLRHQSRKLRNFVGMAVHVLTVTRAVFQPPD